MTVTYNSPAATALPSSLHPLEPLTAEEILAALAILKAHQALDDRVRFISITLHEPSKDLVLSYEPGMAIERKALIIVLDNCTGNTYEAIVSITGETVKSWQHIPDVQPPIALDEFFDCEATVKANPEFQAAVRKRGITDIDLVCVDPWSAGWYADDPAHSAIEQDQNIPMPALAVPAE